jgi:hypothetical protein
MKALKSGILTKNDKQGNVLLQFRTLTFKESNIFYAICLETGIIGHGKNEQMAVHDLLILIEDDLFIRAKGDYQLEVEPAADIYRMAYSRLYKERNLTIPQLPKIDLNKIVKKIAKELNPKNPTNYFLNEKIA